MPSQSSQWASLRSRGYGDHWRLTTWSARRRRAFLDSLFVMEEGMRHYFSKAMQAKQNHMKAEIVDSYMQKAIEVAEKVAPYRHARLSAVKLAGAPSNAVAFKDDATADELRAGVMRHIARLSVAGVVDLTALPVPVLE